MRRLQLLLIAAGLALAPSVAAHPESKSDPRVEPSVETFEWSTVKSRVRLGVMVIGLTPELRKHFGTTGDRGVLVGRVEPKSAAAEAGLAVGDIIVAVRGTPIDSGTDVIATLAQTKQGDTVPVQVLRDRKPLTLNAKILESGATSIRETPWPSWLRELVNPFMLDDKETSRT